MQLKLIISFVLGILTTLIMGAVTYLYIDFTNSEKTIANYSSGGSKGNGLYIYDKGDEVMRKAIDKVIKEDIESSPQPEKAKATIKGMLCYPSDFLPSGEVIAKNTVTDETFTISVDGQAVNYQIQVEPGSYNLRYQAHASGNNPEAYISGYYTKCAMESNVDVCEAEDGHDLIPVTVFAGETETDIKLCDFYYSEEPNF